FCFLSLVFVFLPWLEPGTHAAMRGVYTRFRLMDRPAGHHLPTYMVHLYRNFTTNLSHPTDALERSGARRADTVRSVMAKSLMYQETRWIATFDLHTLFADRQIQAAELRVRLPRNEAVSNFTMDVYHHQTCPHSSSTAAVAKQPCPAQQLVGTLNHTLPATASQNWKVFNITSPLLSWLQDKKPDETRRRRITRRKNPERSKSDTAVEPEVNDRALLVIFSHTDSNNNSKPKASLLHTAEQSKFLSAADVRKAKRHKRRRSKRGHWEHGGSKKLLCRRVDLLVDFNQIGWGSWIVFPKRYNAFRCEGACPGPLGEHLNPRITFITSLYKHFHSDRTVSPCCAPTKMSPLSMLYYENGEMLLRHHEDMIVDECGCQ
uniref:Nodal-related 2 n=1 Tax=Neogobius melanostomus TaxID=47308 RepID=A0A8C6WM13_9GOBI